MKRFIVLFVASLTVLLTARLHAATVVDPVLLNAATNVIGEGDEAPGLSLGFGVTSSVGDIAEDAFPAQPSHLEPDRSVLLQDDV